MLTADTALEVETSRTSLHNCLAYQLKEVLGAEEIYINIDLNQGDEEAKAWGCDLTYEYVKINGDYRS